MGSRWTENWSILPEPAQAPSPSQSSWGVGGQKIGAFYQNQPKPHLHRRVYREGAGGPHVRRRELHTPSTRSSSQTIAHDIGGEAVPKRTCRAGGLQASPVRISHNVHQIAEF